MDSQDTQWETGQPAGRTGWMAMQAAPRHSWSPDNPGQQPGEPSWRVGLTSEWEWVPVPSLTDPCRAELLTKAAQGQVTSI